MMVNDRPSNAKVHPEHRMTIASDICSIYRIHRHATTLDADQTFRTFRIGLGFLLDGVEARVSRRRAMRSEGRPPTSSAAGTHTADPM
ncbi:hypothetical protein [Streptomyces sp. NPDC127066]|uniref:hypothetical protein n=1 Tax=Streptomyces sp. NPDC127066 TaxID=3347125 RepID=UPI0036581AC8